MKKPLKTSNAKSPGIFWNLFWYSFQQQKPGLLWDESLVGEPRTWSLFAEGFWGSLGISLVLRGKHTAIPMLINVFTPLPSLLAAVFVPTALYILPIASFFGQQVYFLSPIKYSLFSSLSLLLRFCQPRLLPLRPLSGSLCIFSPRCWQPHLDPSGSVETCSDLQRAQRAVGGVCPGRVGGLGAESCGCTLGSWGGDSSGSAVWWGPCVGSYLGVWWLGLIILVCLT